MEDDSRYEGDENISDPGRLLQHSDEANNMDEVVSEVM